MLRYLLVLAAHTLKKYSKKMKNKYLSLVRRIGRNRAIVAIARILAETIFTMLKKDVDFVDEIIPLTERKVRKMIERANSVSAEINIQENIKLISSKGSGSENPEFRDLFITDHKLEGLMVLRKVSNNSNISIIYKTRNSEIVLEEIISQKMRAYFSDKQSQSK